MKNRVVYEWPDGVFVEMIVRRDSGLYGALFSIRRPDPSAPLFTMELVARAFQGKFESPMMIAFKSGSTSKPIDSAFLPKLLGFLLDLGAEVRRYPTRIPRRSLIPKDGGPSQKEDYAPYPRFVSDIRWENRYEEAKRFTQREHLVWSAEADLRTENYLGLLRNFEILPPEFYLDDIWHATYSSMAIEHIESAYFHGLIDRVLDEELILPESSKSAWEAAHVERGTFVLPSQEQVEVYRILDEMLPLLLPMEQLEEWLRGQE
jgi:hypothetical protein